MKARAAAPSGSDRGYSTERPTVRRIAVLLSLSLTACPRAPEKPEPASVAVPGPASASVATEPPGPAERTRDEAVLLGTIHRLGTKLCKSIDQADWEDVHLRAGLVRLEGNVGGLEALRGTPVILFGSVLEQGEPKLPRDPGTCLPIQRRSDWIDGPDGVILRRDAGPGLASFRVRASRRFEQLAARLDGDDLAIDFTNPLDVGLEQVALLVHYEGCYGKALTHTERRELGKLAPGARKSARATGIANVTQGSRPNLTHRAVSVQVTGRAEHVYFDLDVPLGGLGVQLSCPKR